MKRKIPKSRGFTLIEVLVATSLFVVVTVIATGSLLTILNANKKAQNISSSINNAFFSIETMTRLIRTGVNYHCGSGTVAEVRTPKDCSDGESLIYFFDDQGRLNRLSLTAKGSIRRAVDKGGNKRVGDADDDLYDITSADFNVENLKFTVTNSKPTRDSDYVQPTVTIVLNGVARPGSKEASPIEVETTVTQRILDI